MCTFCFLAVSDTKLTKTGQKTYIILEIFLIIIAWLSLEMRGQFYIVK